MWRRLVGASAVGLAAALVGCVGDQSGRINYHPDVIGQIAAVGAGEPSGVARAQKPDGQSGDGLPVLPCEATSEAAHGSAAAHIAVTVNGQAILSEEVHALAYAPLMDAQRIPDPAERARKTREATAKALDELIEREVVMQDVTAKLKAHNNEKSLKKLEEAARKEFEKQWLNPLIKANNCKDKADFARFLKSQNLSLEMVERHWERKFMSSEYLRSMVFDKLGRVNHPEIEAYYKAHPDDFKVEDNLTWQDLFVDAGRFRSRDEARRFAQSLAQRIRNGEDMVKLVEQYDNGDSTLRNGAGLGAKRGEIQPPEAEAVLFSLKEGEVGPLVEMPGGFHVVRVTQREYAGVRPFDEKVQRQIRDKLRNDLAQREIRRMISDLKRKAIIEYAAQ